MLFLLLVGLGYIPVCFERGRKAKSVSDVPKGVKLLCVHFCLLNWNLGLSLLVWSRVTSEMFYMVTGALLIKF